VVPLADLGGEEYGTEKLFHKEVNMHKVCTALIGLAAVITQSVLCPAPLFAALVAYDEQAYEAYSPDVDQNEASWAQPHAELQSISAPIATFCYPKAAEPVLYAVAHNRKARIVEALRVMKEVRGCFALTLPPELSDETVIWTGKATDDGEEITLVMYQALALVVVSAEVFAFEPGVLICWYTDKYFRCF
jgi:hypothetical protein